MVVEPKAPCYRTYVCVRNSGFFVFLFLDVEIQGYLHSLSPIKSTKKKQTPYFDFFLQTSDTNKVRGICYEPQQRKNLLQPFQKKSPVKITGTKRISRQAYTCFNNALQSFLASIEKSTSSDDITKDQLEDLFLNAGTVQMVVNNSMHVIDQFLPKAM